MVLLWAVVFVLLGVASALDVSRRALRGPGADATAAEDVADHPVAAAVDLRLLTDPQLSLAWHTSQVRLDALVDAEQSAAAARLAGARCGYLDELERRHPEDFRAWLAGGDTGEFPSAAPDGVR